jgi:hypothetical protein
VAAETATVNIPRDVIEPVIQAHVQAAIVSALGDGQQLISEAIGRILNQKVGDKGEPSSYSNAIPWINWVLRDCVQQAVRKVIIEELPKHEAVIRAGIAADLQRKNSPLIKQFVQGMVAALTDDARLRYRVVVDMGDKAY